MPMHDWTRVDANDYHDFHFAWIAALRQSLNCGRLPAGYYAMAEHTVVPFVPDVLTLEVPAEVGDDFPREADSASGVIATAAPPKTRVAATERGRKVKPVGRRRVAIRHARNRHLVAVIEIVSPSNKRKQKEFADLIAKSVQLLRQGVHLLLIDPFPPTTRDPHGLHAALWKELTGKRFVPSENKPLTLASYVARGDNVFSAFVEPLAVGDPLIDMPLFLTHESHVEAPLVETYQTAWSGFPAPLRPILEGAPAS
jgi:Protein of unknown function (DUF4058)